jgi:hypothetical protein
MGFVEPIGKVDVGLGSSDSKRTLQSLQLDLQSVPSGTLASISQPSPAAVTKTDCGRDGFRSISLCCNLSNAKLQKMVGSTSRGSSRNYQSVEIEGEI